MKKPLHVISLAVAAVLIASGCTTTAVHRSDSAALQGSWTGQEVGRSAEGACTLAISGNALEFHDTETQEWYKGTYTLQEDLNPKQLNGLITNCPAPEYIGTTVHAIYRIDAGTLTLAGDQPGNPEAPKTFDAAGARMFVFKKRR